MNVDKLNIRNILLVFLVYLSLVKLIKISFFKNNIININKLYSETRTFYIIKC